MMEHDPNYSMETLYELCESWFCKGIDEEISGSEGTKKGGIYMMLAKEK